MPPAILSSLAGVCTIVPGWNNDCPLLDRLFHIFAAQPSVVFSGISAASAFRRPSGKSPSNIACGKGDARWYAGTVSGASDRNHHVLYDDGERWAHDMRETRWVLN